MTTAVPASEPKWAKRASAPAVLGFVILSGIAAVVLYCIPAWLGYRYRDETVALILDRLSVFLVFQAVAGAFYRDHYVKVAYVLAILGFLMPLYYLFSIGLEQALPPAQHP